MLGCRTADCLQLVFECDEEEADQAQQHDFPQHVLVRRQQAVLLPCDAPVSRPDNELQPQTMTALAPAISYSLVSSQRTAWGCVAHCEHHVRQVELHAMTWLHLLEEAGQKQEANEHQQYDVGRRVQQRQACTSTAGFISLWTRSRKHAALQSLFVISPVPVVTRQSSSSSAPHPQQHCRSARSHPCSRCRISSP